MLAPVLDTTLAIGASYTMPTLCSASSAIASAGDPTTGRERKGSLWCALPVGGRRLSLSLLVDDVDVTDGHVSSRSFFFSGRADDASRVATEREVRQLSMAAEWWREGLLGTRKAGNLILYRGRSLREST